MWKKTEAWIHKHEWWLAMIIVVILLRLPSLFEPYWYGDEGIYLTLGQAINRGVELYKGIHDNKPPFLYFMAAVAGGNQFWFKFLALVWNLATVGVFIKLAQKVFGNHGRAIVVSTWVFALLTTLPFWEGNIANAELFFLLPTLGAAYLLWDKNVKPGRVFLGGVFIGLASLFKMPALLEAGVWALVWVATGEKEWWKKILILGGGCMVPVGLSVGYYWMAGSLNQYLTAAWFQNIPYLSSWKASSGGEGVYSVGGRAVVAVVALAVLLGLWRRAGRVGVIVGAWWIITLFSALLSGRPYPHYLLQTAGAVALAVGMVTRRKSEELVVVGLGLTLLVLSIVTFKFYTYPVVGYYKNFMEWAAGVKSKDDYYNWFGKGVNTNYRVAELVVAGSKPEDKLFIWGDEPAVYALSRRQPLGRYTAKYHIKDFGGFEETLKLLTEKRPKYVVVYGDGSDFPGLMEAVEEGYTVEREIGEAKVMRLMGATDSTN